MMNNKGLTLVELIVVLAIIALAAGLVATNFFGLIKSGDDFEDKTLAKGIAEAAYVFYDSKDNTDHLTGCQPISVLIDKGYISNDQGLLKNYTAAELATFYYKVDITNNEKKAKAYRNTGTCRGNSCCSGNPLYIY